MSGLQDPDFLARKKKEEAGLQTELSRVPDRQQLNGSVWKGLTDFAAHSRVLYPKLLALESAPMTFGSILPIARHVYRLAVESDKPNGERLREYAGAGLASLEDSLFSPAPMTPGLEKVILAEYLRFALRVLGSTNDTLWELLGGLSPE